MQARQSKVLQVSALIRLSRCLLLFACLVHGALLRHARGVDLLLPWTQALVIHSSLRPEHPMHNLTEAPLWRLTILVSNRALRTCHMFSIPALKMHQGSELRKDPLESRVCVPVTGFDSRHVVLLAAVILRSVDTCPRVNLLT